jgi:uncharacterized protein YukE
MSWVGGDIAGLQAMGTAMAAAKDKTGEIGKTLDQRVDALADDSDWSGESAERFRKVWSANSIQVGLVNSAASQAGTTIKTLGDELQQLETDLHNAAAQYQAKGVPIGPNGAPEPVVVTGDPSKNPARDVLQAAKEYKELYDSTMLLARKARTDCADSLSDLLQGIQPTGDAKGGGAKPEDWATASDYVRGLYAVPNEQLKNADKLAAELADARQRFKDTRPALKAAKAEYAAKGLKLPATSDAALAHSNALKDLNEAADKIGQTAVPKGVLPGSDWLNVKLGDLPMVFGTGGALAKALPKELEFLKDIPVLDVAATGFIGVQQASEDHDKGWSTVRSYATDLGAGVLGLGAGAVAVAIAPEAAPVLAVAAISGGIVVGVGNIAYDAFHEHWSEDVHNDGVLAGIGEGAWHSAWGGIKDTGSQIADVGETTWNGAKSLWHGVFG